MGPGGQHSTMDSVLASHPAAPGSNPGSAISLLLRLWIVKRSNPSSAARDFANAVHLWPELSTTKTWSQDSAWTGDCLGTHGAAGIGSNLILIRGEWTVSHLGHHTGGSMSRWCPFQVESLQAIRSIPLGNKKVSHPRNQDKPIYCKTFDWIIKVYFVLNSPLKKWWPDIPEQKSSIGTNSIWDQSHKRACVCKKTVAHIFVI